MRRPDAVSTQRGRYIEYTCPLCVLTASGLLMNIPAPLCTYSIRSSHEYICSLCVLTASGFGQIYS
jgi:hypothetical protein